MKFSKWAILLVISLAMVSCRGGEAQATTESEASLPPIPTITPDPCSEQNLPGEMAKVNKLTREFDDYSSLASNTPQAQLVVVIPELQRVLRESEEQAVPACLLSLKKLQLSHMSVVVQTLMAFMGNSDAELVNQGIATSRELHNQYDIELARLLGITLVPAAPTSASTPEAAVPVTPQVLNAGATEINLRSLPDANSVAYGALPAGQFAIVRGRTEDNQWIQVEIPAQPGVNAWVFAALVQLSVPIEQLPVVP